MDDPTVPEFLRTMTMGEVSFEATPLGAAVDYLHDTLCDFAEAMASGALSIFLALADDDPLRAAPVTLKLAEANPLDVLGRLAQLASPDGRLWLIVTARGACLCRTEPAPVPPAPVPDNLSFPPDSLERRIATAEGYSELGLFEEVLAELDGFATPECARLQGDALCNLARWTELVELSQVRLAQMDPDPIWCRWKPLALLRLGHNEPAREHLELAVQCFPEDGTLACYLACVLTRLGDVEAARAHLYRAMALQPACRRAVLDTAELALFWPELKQAQ